MKLLFMTALAVALAACGGSGAGLDANGRPISGEPMPLLPQFQSIQEHVFTPICTTCHAGSAAPLGFRLDADSAYAMLVNAPSVEVPGLQRVSPGEPDASYLVQKLEGSAAVGGRMPLGQAPLPRSTIDIIRQWIEEGALQNATAAQTAGQTSAVVGIEAVVPIAGELLAQPPRELILQADGAFDVAALTAETISLRSSGGDGSFVEGNEVWAGEADIVVRSLDPTIIALTFAQAVWLPDVYELTLAGSGFRLQFTIEAAP